MSLIASVLLVPLEPSLADRLQAHCTASGRPIEAVVREALALRLALAEDPHGSGSTRPRPTTTTHVRAWHVDRGGRDRPR